MIVHERDPKLQGDRSVYVDENGVRHVIRLPFD